MTATTRASTTPAPTQVTSGSVSHPGPGFVPGVLTRLLAAAGQTGSNVLMAPLLKEIQFVTLLVDNLTCRCSGAPGDTLNKDRIIKDL